MNIDKPKKRKTKQLAAGCCCCFLLSAFLATGHICFLCVVRDLGFVPFSISPSFRVVHVSFSTPAFGCSHFSCFRCYAV